MNLSPHLELWPSPAPPPYERFPVYSSSYGGNGRRERFLDKSRNFAGSRRMAGLGMTGSEKVLLTIGRTQPGCNENTPANVALDPDLVALRAMADKTGDKHANGVSVINNCSGHCVSGWV
jgi:hypothetical protein